MENEEQVVELCGFGCYFGQGFHYFRPLSCHEIFQLISPGPALTNVRAIYRAALIGWQVWYWPMPLPSRPPLLQRHQDYAGGHQRQRQPDTQAQPFAEN